MAFGALAGGIKLVTGYPGSPSSGTVEQLISLANDHNVYVEWSSNEKVAVELAIGASIAGCRVLVCVKSVGMNVMIDPLMALNLTPVNGGLVILLGDDPGAYGSQNDQDSRPLAHLLEMPMMEPASPAESYAMMQEAFGISEKYQTAVIIRETRSFSQQVEWVNISEKPYQQVNLGLIREPLRFVPVPKNAVEKHRNLHERMELLTEWANNAQYNLVTGKGNKGIVGAGFAYTKILDALDIDNVAKFKLLKLGLLYPLPAKVIIGFLESCREVLIVEENGPFIENQIKSLAYETGCSPRIYGKKSGHFSREGEVFRWQIQQAIKRFSPGFIPGRRYLAGNESEEKPAKKSFCTNCRYNEVLDHLDSAAKSLAQKPVLIGDPGCLVTVADRIDAKYAIGSAVGVADGLSKAGIDERAIAIFGDSSFFHTSLPAICNAVHNRSNILMVVLDNKATATSGFQPNPGIGKDALGREAPALDIERVARACGVKSVYTADLDDHNPTLEETFKKVLNQLDLTLVIVRISGIND